MHAMKKIKPALVTVGKGFVNSFHITGHYNFVKSPLSSGSRTQRKTNIWVRDKVAVKEKECFIKRRQLAKPGP